jgi:hypothetical protein
MKIIGCKFLYTYGSGKDKGNYSRPNLLRRVKPTPKKRTAATGQIDQVIEWFWYTSIPTKKAQIIIPTAIWYHHFFSPFPPVASLIILIIAGSVDPDG